MLAEWSAECSADDPVLVVPWSGDSSGNLPEDSPEGSPISPPATHPTPHRTPHFIDLRANPYDLDLIPEAEQHPPLLHALRALNVPRSPVFSAKCDAWPLDPDELAHLHLNLDVAPADAPSGFASYIDLVPRDRPLFTSFHSQDQMLRRLCRLATPLDLPYASLDCILRPALVDLEGPQEGFAFTLYVKALGPDPQAASKNWAAALEAIVALVRSKSLARSKDLTR